MLTFETLFELLRKEKINPELQKLEEDFYQQTIEYLKDKSGIIENEQKTKSIFSANTKKTQLQLENARKIIKEFYEKRESKVVNLAILSSRAEIRETGVNMLKEEKNLYKETLETLNRYREGILQNTFSGNKISVKQLKTSPKDIKTEQRQSTGNRMVRFLHSVPKFVADDLNIYGPFEQEDMSCLPRKTANLLIKRNRAEEIKIENSKD